MFNDRYGLTKSVLDGRKTMTRRMEPICEILQRRLSGNFSETSREVKNHYSLGEVVAVAQSYMDAGYIVNRYKALADRNYGYISGNGINEIPMPWPIAGATNKMFVRAGLMPHQIRITGIRVERLQDISDEDCMKEGIERMPYGGGFKPYAFYDTSIKIKSKKEGVSYGWYKSYDTPREAFAALIDKVSGRGTWESNPLVVVYEFEFVK